MDIQKVASTGTAVAVIGGGSIFGGNYAIDQATGGPDKRIKLFLTYPMATGRNFNELLRVIDSLQLTAKHKVATPANWNRGDEVIIVPSVKEEETKELFPDGWTTIKPYLRKVPDPFTKE